MLCQGAKPNSTTGHIPDVLTVPGFVAAQRFELSEQQRRDPPYPWQYVAIYEAETDDLSKTINALKERSGSPSMPISDAMAAQRVAWFFKPITERVTAKSGASG